MGNSYRRRRSITLLALLSLLLANLLAGCTPGSIDSFTQSIDLRTSLFTITTKSQTQETHPGAASAEGQETSGSEQFLLVEELVIIMLFVAVLVGLVAHRLRIPYTIGLVLVGLLMTLRGAVEITISPTLILGLLVPPLIFEAAFHLNLRDLRLNLVPITILAVPGVLLTTLLVGGIVALGAGIALPIALVFGAIVSATDPVSVVALFRKLGVPKRLSVLLEGESLFNDGTAIVVFQLVLTIAVAGAGSFNLANGLIDFLVIAGGGLVVGLLLGTLVSELIKRIDDYLIETTLTSVLAFGSFLVAELLGVSGVLAVVAAGLVNGNIGPRGMSPTTRIVVFNFWEYAAFLANTFVFLLIGLQIDLPALFQSWQSILWAIIAILDRQGCQHLRVIPHRAQHPAQVAARALLGRAARRDLPGAGIKPARPARLRQQPDPGDDLRCSFVYLVGAGAHHEAPGAPAGDHRAPVRAEGGVRAAPCPRRSQPRRVRAPAAPAPARYAFRPYLAADSPVTARARPQPGKHGAGSDGG